MSITCSLCNYTYPTEDPACGNPCGSCSDTIIVAAEKRAGRPLTQEEDKEVIKLFMNPLPPTPSITINPKGSILTWTAPGYTTRMMRSPNILHTAILHTYYLPPSHPILDKLSGYTSQELLNEEGEIANIFTLPEHREDEDYQPDPLFGPQPFDRDSFGEQELYIDHWGAPIPHFTMGERMLREHCDKVRGKVIAPHEPLISTPWYLTAEYISKILQCSVQDAQVLADSWSILDTTPHIVNECILHAKELPYIQDAITYWSQLAEQIALIEAGVTKPTQLILPESLSLAECLASITEASYYQNSYNYEARKLWQAAEARVIELKRRPTYLQREYGKYLQPITHIPGEDAMEQTINNKAIELYAKSLEDFQELTFEEATLDEDDTEPDDEISVPTEEEWAPIDAWLEGSSKEIYGVQVSTGPTEAWHILDEVQEKNWEDYQPASYVVILNKTRNAKNLDILKTFGQSAYHADRWDTDMKKVFWSAYNARKDALLQEASKHPKVQKAITKIKGTPVKALPLLGKRLFDFTKKQPDYYPKDGLVAIWKTFKDMKAEVLTPILPSKHAQVIKAIKDFQATRSNK